MPGLKSHQLLSYAKTKLEQNIQNDTVFIPTPQNTFNVEASVRLEIPRAKKTIKHTIQEQTLELWNCKVEQLTMQKDFAQLLIEEKVTLLCLIRFALSAMLYPLCFIRYALSAMLYPL